MKAHKQKNEGGGWIVCEACKGQGKKNKGLGKKAKANYQAALAAFENSGSKGMPPFCPKGQLYVCPDCSGTGLVAFDGYPVAKTQNYPHVAIIGGGIGGVALAVACLHRKIPFTLYERDSNFSARSQGYGLTLQQASKAMQAFGITSLKEKVISTRHVVHTTNGKIVGEWGTRKSLQHVQKASAKRTNMHIARQYLRLALLEQLGGQDAVQWGHQLLSFEQCQGGGVALKFQEGGKIKNVKADILVGADGIRSSVRRLLIGENKSPLGYLDCIVILGICKLSDIKSPESDLLDSATVFQTANGNERIYIMPYTATSVMWQLSFPMPEDEAKELSAKGAKALKEEACKRTQWHSPVPQIIAATTEDYISGYPVYDRALLTPEMLQNAGPVTLIGDAAHPMSPFKGQGANQALLDALSLARTIDTACRSSLEWKTKGVRELILKKFEQEMLERSAVKVKDSAEAAQFLHSEIAVFERDSPRGSCIR